MYEYDLEWHSTHQHGNADTLSRLLLPNTPLEIPVPAEQVLLMEHLESSPVTAMQINNWTLKDPVLSQVLHYIKQGWPNQVNSEMQPYWSKRIELSVTDDCILWGNRVLVPKLGQQHVLQELHGGILEYPE